MPGTKYLDIRIFGVPEVKRQLFRGAAAAGNMKPVLEEVGLDMMYVIGLNFASQGRRGGGSWRQLTPEWLARKMAAGLSPEILVATGALHDSMTQPGDPDQFYQVTNRSIKLESRLPYAEAHQHGNDHLPARPFVHFMPSDRERWVKMCERYLREAMGGLK